MRAAIAAPAAVLGLAALPATPDARFEGTEDVLLVGDNWDGTAHVLDPKRFTRLARIDIVPDLEERRAQIFRDPVGFGLFLGIRALIGEATTSWSTTCSPPTTAGRCSSPARAWPTWSRSTSARGGSSGGWRWTATVPTT